MKRVLVMGSAFALVALFVVVLFASHSPIPQDSSTLPCTGEPAARPYGSDLSTRVDSSTFTLNAPLLILQTPGGGEVRLNYGTDVTTKFFGSDQFAQVGLNLADRTLDRAMVEAVRASGNDTNIEIAGNGHSATLKPGQTVYYGVMLTESGMAKADAVTFVLKTVPIFGVPDITNNYFTIKYAELIGGGTGLGDINVRDDSTSGKAFQVIRPAGNRLFFFAFTAFARAGGIRTTIENHFFQGPAITQVTPNLLLSGCNELKTPLLDVPKLVYNCWYGGYYVDAQLLCRFKKDLATKLKCNTDPYVAVDDEPSPNIYTVRIEGKQLPTGLEPSNVLMGQPGDVEVVQVVESAIDHVTVKVKFLRTATGPLSVSLLTPEGTLTSDGLVRAAKLISDVPDTAPGELKFDGFRIVGVPDVIKMCQRVDGTHILYAKPIYQIYNITNVCLNGDRTALTTVTTGGDCLNVFTNGEQGGSTPGQGPMTTSAILPDHPVSVLACTMMKGNFEITCEMKLSPDAVKPDETTNVTVTVQQDGKPLENTEVVMQAEAVENSGGHQHDGSRPVGKFSPAKGMTDKNGVFTTKYTASSFGGEEKIIAKVGGKTCEATLNVRIPDLVELGKGTDYELIGEKEIHPNNHFGTKKTIDAIKAISKAYHEKFPKDPLLAWNDISLAKGGLFDVKGNWSPPHKTHRVGNIVDLRIENVPEKNQPKLEEIIVANGGEVLKEKKPPHWHITFK